MLCASGRHYHFDLSVCLRRPHRTVLVLGLVPWAPCVRTGGAGGASGPYMGEVLTSGRAGPDLSPTPIYYIYLRLQRRLSLLRNSTRLQQDVWLITRISLPVTAVITTFLTPWALSRYLYNATYTPQRAALLLAPSRVVFFISYTCTFHPSMPTITAPRIP